MISSSFCLALRSASFASVRSCFRWSASFNLEPEFWLLRGRWKTVMVLSIYSNNPGVLQTECCVWFPLILDTRAWCLSETLELYLTLHPFKGNHEVMWLQRDLNKSGKIPQVISVWRTQFENGQKSVMHIEKLYELYKWDTSQDDSRPPLWLLHQLDSQLLRLPHLLLHQPFLLLRLHGSDL